MTMCLDTVGLQLYMDGELAPAAAEAVATHLTICAPCAALARATAHEYAMFAAAFAPNVSARVPSERLRLRLADAIADLEAPPRPYVAVPPVSRLRAWWTAVAAYTCSPRQLAAFATFLVAIALTVTLSLLRPQPADSPVAANEPAAANEPVAAQESVAAHESVAAQESVAAAPSVIQSDRAAAPAPPVLARPAVARVTETTTRGRSKPLPWQNNGPQFVAHGGPVRARVERTPESVAPVVPSAPTTTARAPQPPGLLPEERSYLRTIATLNATIETQPLTPTMRAEYARSLAVVDQAIVATRIAARRNPQDPDAKEFLRAAYQNKVELLATIADQPQFVAAQD